MTQRQLQVPRMSLPQVFDALRGLKEACSSLSSEARNYKIRHQSRFHPINTGGRQVWGRASVYTLDWFPVNYRNTRLKRPVPPPPHPTPRLRFEVRGIPWWVCVCSHANPAGVISSEIRNIKFIQRVANL